MSNIELINRYPLSKSSQKEMADSIMQPLFDGDIDAIEFITKINGLIASLNDVVKNKDVKEMVIREIEKNGKSASYNGAQLTVKEGGVKYDYTACNDPQYYALMKQKEELDKQIKERETFLKTVPDGTTVLDDSTGEVFQLYRAVRTATETFAIQFSK